MLQCIGCLEGFRSPHLLLPLLCLLSCSMAESPTYLPCNHSAVSHTCTYRRISALPSHPTCFNACLLAIHQTTRVGDSGVHSRARKSSWIALFFANLFSLSTSLDCLESMYLLTHRLLPLLLPNPPFQLTFPRHHYRWLPCPWHLSSHSPMMDWHLYMPPIPLVWLCIYVSPCGPSCSSSLSHAVAAWACGCQAPLDPT